MSAGQGGGDDGRVALGLADGCGTMGFSELRGENLNGIVCVCLLDSLGAVFWLYMRRLLSERRFRG